MRWLALLSLSACPATGGHRIEIADFDVADVFILDDLGDGSDFGNGSFGGLGLEVVTNADWVDDARWIRIEAADSYKLAIDSRGLDLFVHEASLENVWEDALRPEAWSELVNINLFASVFHRDVYAFDRQFRFAVPSETPDGANPPSDTPLVNRITAKGALKAWVAYTGGGDGASLSVLDGLNVASVTPQNGGLSARVALAAPIDGTVAVEAHYNHRGLPNGYRLIVTKEVGPEFVDIEHYDVEARMLRDQRAADHGVTYVFVYGRQD